MRQTLLEYCGLAIPSTGKDILEQEQDEYPILADILEYKKYAKLAEFGELYEKIDPITGRIHASFNQIVSTGRFSCSAPNLMQIPSRTEEGARLRSLFVAREGYRFVQSDYAGIELVILGVKGKDPVLLEALNSGKDLHIFTMSQMIGTDYFNLFNAKEKLIDAVDFDSLKKARQSFEDVFTMPTLSGMTWDEKGLLGWVKALRNDIKTLTYGVAYQLSKFGLARKFHCEVTDAEKFIEKFFSVYQGVGKYVNSIGEIGYRNGYAETGLGRKRFFRMPKRKTESEIVDQMVKVLVKEGRNIKEMQSNRYEWNELVDEAIKIHKKEITSQINAIKREAGNMPIQGASADITKLAMVLFDGYLKESGEFEPDEALLLVVHDELIAECREEKAPLMAELMEKAMVESAVHFLGAGVLIEAKPSIELYWKK